MFWKAGLLSGLAFLLVGCEQGESRSTILTVERAGWRGEVVQANGEWTKGLSTPPLCRILEARDGPVSNQFESDARVSLDGVTFSKQFVLTEDARENPPDADEDFYVRCTVGLDSGRSAEDIVEVERDS